MSEQELIALTGLIDETELEELAEIPDVSGGTTPAVEAIGATIAGATAISYAVQGFCPTSACTRSC
jgi:hypothetical protein